jgi:hypothetical protein
MEIPRFQASGGGPDRIDPLGILAAWWRAVGAPVARLASPRGVSGGKLIVVVPDLRWKRAIGEHLDEILFRLRNTEGLREILGIEMRVEQSGELSAERVRSGGEVSSSRQPPARSAPEEILIEAGPISDPLQGRRWEEAVARILARRGEIHDT